MKVVHGTMEIANQAYTITRQIRQQGVAAATISYYPTYLGYQADFEYPVAQQKDAAQRDHDLAMVAIGAMQEFDVFHFWFNTTFTLDYSDLPLLSKLGRPVFMQHCGSDVRTEAIAKAMNPYAVVKQGADPQHIHQQLSLVSRFIDTAIVGETRLYEYVKQYYRKVHMVPITLDCTQYPVAEDHLQNERPLVVHAPTSPQYKGTKYVLAAVEALEKKYDFDFQLVQGVAHEEAKRIFRRADIIVDQLLGGGYGGLSTEGMAMGKTVVVWVSPKAREGYPEDVPVVSANPDTIEAQLRVALNDVDLRRDLGVRGPAYVRKYHDAPKIAATMLKIYRGEGVDDSPFQVWW